VVTLDFLHSLAYIKTVESPVNIKHHQPQLPDTPLDLTRSVTKFGVSVENVVATIEKPNNHHGMLRPDKKYSEVFFPDFLETYTPMKSTIAKNPKIMK
jgi:hypothetical protein